MEIGVQTDATLSDCSRQNTLGKPRQHSFPSPNNTGGTGKGDVEGADEAPGTVDGAGEGRVLR